MARYGRLLRMGEAKNSTFGEIRTIDGERPERLEKMLGDSFRGFSKVHPCIGARGVMTNGALFYSAMGDMKSVESALNVVQVIEKYLSVSDAIDDPVKTLALFFTDTFDSPEAFSNQYWAFVQRVHDIDVMTNRWDPDVSDDPSDPAFELSIAGRAIFTTTLHPGHPRAARRFSYPTWVCNQKRQFDQLRDKENFENWKNSIRKSDAELDPSGTPNPILADHGYASAAQQLSGWPVDPCPLRVRHSYGEKLSAADAIIAAATARELEPGTIDELGRRYGVLTSTQ